VSPLTPDEASAALAAQTKAGFLPRLFQHAPGATFIGSVEGGTFKIRRSIHYANAFLPVARGTIASEGSGALVAGDLRLTAGVAVFAAVWLSGVVAWFVVALIQTAATRSHWLLPLAAVPFFLVGLAIIALPFEWEARRTERDLRRLLSAARDHADDEAQR
jgi:hypothetical protein